jgi:1,4-alpha-glucan branching enzyme
VKAIPRPLLCWSSAYLFIAICGCSGGHDPALDASSVFDVRRDHARDAGADLEKNKDSTSPQPDAAIGVDLGPRDHSRFAGHLLGAAINSNNVVEFSLFAPGAKTVHVVGSFNGWKPDAHALEKNEQTGIFSAGFLIRDPVGQQYKFLIDQKREVVDPYSRANLQSRGASLLIDTRYGWTDQRYQRPARSRLVIYEMHVSDFTSHGSSGVDSAASGRFAGVLAKIAYLKRLGVNAVELMPIAENQSDGGYSWGYNPALFFAPEAGLASRYDGAQVKELKALVDALHQAGIAVILDVVFNHVWGTEGDNPLWDIDPLYYFDYDDNGDPENDKTPWGYKVASWRPMVQKLIFDNLKHWMDAYHIDGFRIDSTENMHADALIETVEKLSQAGYADRYFIFEEFSNDHNTRIQQANSRAKSALISSWGTSYKNTVWAALAGTVSDSLGPVTYYSRDSGWRRPAAVINYFSSHDEGTISARFGASKQQVKVAAAHLLTSLGVPMIWMGDELLRQHYGNYHPKGSGASLRPENNIFDWTLEKTNGDLVDYYGALIRLRIAHPVLHLASADEVGAYFDWVPSSNWKTTIGYKFFGLAKDNDFVVLINYDGATRKLDVPFPSLGKWHVMCDGKLAKSTLPSLRTIDVSSTTKPQTISVPPRSAMILMSERVNP